MSRPDASGDTEMIRFRYDSSGHRIRKDSGVYHASYSGSEIVYAGETTRTSYSYLGDTLTQVNIDAPTGSTSLHFTYDELGPMSVTYDGTEYFYLKNAQGDVTGLVNSSGTQVVAYIYDAWGNPLTTTGTMADTLGKLNPFRYRGYVYDTETGLYYLGSRYYNPTWGRFVNADSVSLLASSPENVAYDKNLFNYCDNNPIVRVDGDGDLWSAIIGGVVGGIASAVTQYIDNGKIDPWKVGASFVLGVIGGIGAATPLKNALIGAVTNTVDTIISNADDPTMSSGEKILDAAVSAGMGFLTSFTCPTVNTAKMDVVTKKTTSSVKKYVTTKVVKKSAPSKALKSTIKRGSRYVGSRAFIGVGGGLAYSGISYGTRHYTRAVYRSHRR